MARSRNRTRRVLDSSVQAEITVGRRSHVGVRRPSNEDQYCALKAPNAPFGSDALLAVADGMGGHQAGEIASEMAIRGLVDRLASLESDPPRRVGLDLVLSGAVAELNGEVHEASARPEQRGMGTTLTAAVLIGDRMTIAHVGDSRAYIHRDGQLRQLTVDHSWVAEQVARGGLTPEEAEKHPNRNIITRAIGLAGSVDIDTKVVAIRKGDVILLCSDGLTTMVNDHDIARVLSNGAPQEASDEFVDLANDRGGEDNITVVVARVDMIGPRSQDGHRIHSVRTMISDGSTRSSGEGIVNRLGSPFRLFVSLVMRPFRRDR